MKNMFKFLITCMLLISCLSFGAFAANTVTISDDTISESDKSVAVSFTADGFAEGDDLTILVFKVTEELSEPDESNIVYVEQPEYTEGMQSINFKLPEDAEGTYEVRVGGTGVEAYTAGQFTVRNVIFGDLNNDGVLDNQDAIVILQVFFNASDMTVEVEKNECDFNDDGIVNAKDAVYLLQQIK